MSSNDFNKLIDTLLRPKPGRGKGAGLCKVADGVSKKVSAKDGERNAMKLGYARVSTDDQNLDLQLAALKKAGCNKVCTDQGVSGSARSRPGLDEALTALNAGDTLVVWKLDRLSRSLHHLLILIEDLDKRDITFHTLTENIETHSPAGRMYFHVFAALAEFERSLIGERTKEGLAAARRRGARLGRPSKLDETQLRYAEEQIEAKTETLTALARTFRVHKSVLSKALKRRRSLPDGTNKAGRRETTT